MANDYKKIAITKKEEAEKIMTKEQFYSCEKAINTLEITAIGSHVALSALELAGGCTTGKILKHLRVSRNVMRISEIKEELNKMIALLGKVFGKELTEFSAKFLDDSNRLYIDIEHLEQSNFRKVENITDSYLIDAVGWTIAVNLAKSEKAYDTVSINDEIIDDGKKTSNTNSESACDDFIVECDDSEEDLYDE